MAIISRRNFLKAACASVAAGLLMGLPKNASAESAAKGYAILFDGIACTGCELCQFGCKVRNNLSQNFETFLGPETYVYVSSGTYEGKDVKVRYSCMHCEDAPCFNSCPVNAIEKSKDGFVHINPKRCIGCGYCVVVCPYGVPRFDPDEGVATKCTGCYDLVEKGDAPACVQACPWNALHFKKREEIVAMAKEIQSKNDGSFVYGLEERGGLHVIYVLPVEPVSAGLFPDVMKTGSLYPSNYIYEPLLLGIAPIVGLAAGALYFKKKEK